MIKLVILDRDGVINQDSKQFIKSADEWIALDGSLAAIALLNQHDFHIAIATNQSGIARGLFDLATLNSMHDKMHFEASQVGGHIDAVFYCPHAADDHCKCRKPKTGMIEAISKHFSVSINNTPAVGDALRDLQAFAKAGCQPILVRTGKGQETLDAAQADVSKALPDNTWICDDLADAAKRIIAEHGQ